MSDWNDMFAGLMDESIHEERRNIKAPFGWPGGKSKSLDKILPHLDTRRRYVEVFGGSAAILLARAPSKVDVYNDAYGGVVDFYRVIRDATLWPQLKDRLDMSIYAREEWQICHDTWKDVNDPVERAARWYYMTVYSFANIGRNFGRGIASSMAGKIQRVLPEFYDIHRRMREVQVENLDWATCMRDYDSKDTVFYLDPPYLSSHKGAYKHEMGLEMHESILRQVFRTQGFVAVSGYSCPTYEDQPWDERYEWKAQVSLDPLKEGAEKMETGRNHAVEVLWIKK